MQCTNSLMQHLHVRNATSDLLPAYDYGINPPSKCCRPTPTSFMVATDTHMGQLH